MKKKIPYGEQNFERLIMQNYYYIDRTQYIEKLESLNEKNIVYLRPRKFGKTLFLDTLSNIMILIMQKNLKNYLKTYT
ncbi:Predicted AAA-ATPase [Marinitoga hydrogenitolerans DSM 16785]|uniref:Predicted AAA-ATPase n=1 Tax=Marinitoga hydrogenitolerans (strain DSM 16785 / JCM 12826 / AT1271) TaxID=1122195 RepID=A0A1M4YU79_MARH1|nr:AAA family ATPase [Marinitoga hydrogenitolerans]SHF09315.1 Predicted AAA-ATPase [Marinitoga hydrogenitolerans DSM 16785]